MYRLKNTSVSAAGGFAGWVWLDVLAACGELAALAEAGALAVLAEGAAAALDAPGALAAFGDAAFGFGCGGGSCSLWRISTKPVEYSAERLS
jgi:hypothetical protein